MKLLNIPVFIALIIFANIKIYRFHENFVNVETELMNKVAGISEKVRSQEKILNPEQQAKLLVAVADRSLELSIFKYAALTISALATICLSFMLFRQLTIRSRGDDLQPRP